MRWWCVWFIAVIVVLFVCVCVSLPLWCEVWAWCGLLVCVADGLYWCCVSCCG